MFPDQELGGRGPPLKNHPQNWSILWVAFQGKSSSCWFLIWEHIRLEIPPGGGGSFDRRDELDESGELQQIAERVAQNLENIYKQIQQTRILPNGIYD